MATVVALPEQFQSLEEDFVESKMAINNAINEILRNECELRGKNALRTGLDGVDQVHASASLATANQLVQAHVVEAQRCMKMMSIEVRGKQPNVRKAMQSKINMYREELQGLLRDLERAQLMAKAQPHKPKASDDSQYERIMNNTNRLMRSSRTLESSQRLVSETEHIGISVLDTLSSQRESLLSAHEKVRETRETTSDARRILQRMTRRIITNTIVLYTVIVLLIIAICFVLYHDFIQVTPSWLTDYFTTTK